MLADVTSLHDFKVYQCLNYFMSMHAYLSAQGAAEKQLADAVFLIKLAQFEKHTISIN